MANNSTRDPHAILLVCGTPIHRETRTGQKATRVKMEFTTNLSDVPSAWKNANPDEIIANLCGYFVRPESTLEREQVNYLASPGNIRVETNFNRQVLKIVFDNIPWESPKNTVNYRPEQMDPTKPPIWFAIKAALSSAVEHSLDPNDAHDKKLIDNPNRHIYFIGSTAHEVTVVYGA